MVNNMKRKYKKLEILEGSEDIKDALEQGYVFLTTGHCYLWKNSKGKIVQAAADYHEPSREVQNVDQLTSLRVLYSPEEVENNRYSRVYFRGEKW